jgi:hypothetical protein
LKLVLVFMAAASSGAAIGGVDSGLATWFAHGKLNLIGTLAVLKFFRHGDFGHDVNRRSLA